MFTSKHLRRVAAIAAGAVIGASATQAMASPGHGVTFTTLTNPPANFLDPDQIISDQIKVGTKDPTTVRIQSAVST